MQNMMHEQSGLPDTSYEETPLLGAQSQQARSWDAITSLFPSANGRLQVKMSGYGKKTYPLFTTDKSTKQTRLNPSFTKEIKDALGKSAEQIIAEDRENKDKDWQKQKTNKDRRRRSPQKG